MKLLTFVLLGTLNYSALAGSIKLSQTSKDEYNKVVIDQRNLEQKTPKPGYAFL